MNKKPLLVGVSFAFLTAASMAQAEGQFYGKLGANVSSSTEVDVTTYSSVYSAKSGVMPEATLGYDLGNGFAVELSYQKSGGSLTNVSGITTGPSGAVTGTANLTPTGGDLIFTSTMIKGIYNIPTDTTAIYNPYIGLGLGKTNIKLDKVTFATNPTPNSIDGSATSMQLTFGNRFKFSQGWFGDVAANYTHIQSASLTNTNGNTLEFDSSKVTSISFAVGKSF